MPDEVVAEAENMISYWERFRDDDEAVIRWAVLDLMKLANLVLAAADKEN